jgi:hypothetical protein
VSELRAQIPSLEKEHANMLAVLRQQSKIKDKENQGFNKDIPK